MTDPTDDGAELVSVLETGDADLLPVIKSVLSATDIPYVVQGDEAFGQLPVGHIRAPFAKHGLAVRILVPKDREEEARAILDSTAEIPDLPEELRED